MRYGRIEPGASLHLGFLLPGPSQREGLGGEGLRDSPASTFAYPSFPFAGLSLGDCCHDGVATFLPRLATNYLENLINSRGYFAFTRQGSQVRTLHRPPSETKKPTGNGGFFVAPSGVAAFRAIGERWPTPLPAVSCCRGEGRHGWYGRKRLSSLGHGTFASSWCRKLFFRDSPRMAPGRNCACGAC